MQERNSADSGESITHAAFDLDGTLLERNGDLLPRILEAFSCLRDRGVRMVLVTGRPPVAFGSEIAENLRSAGFENYFLVGNGNVWIDVSTGERNSLLSLPPHMFQSLERFGVRDVVAETEYAPVASTPRAAAAYAMAYRAPRSEIAIEPAALWDCASSLRVSALTVFGADVRTLPGGSLPGHELDFIGPFGAQIIRPLGTCKATALELYLRRHGEGGSLRSTVAFGDAYNDVCLLRACALGVAVQYADEAARRHSDVHLDRALDDYLLNWVPESMGSPGSPGPICFGGHTHPDSSREHDLVGEPSASERGR